MKYLKKNNNNEKWKIWKKKNNENWKLKKKS